jgi:hypothetical protein
MSRHATTLPVRVRVGDRREWTVGDVPADHKGRVDPERLAALLAAVSDHILVLVDNQLRKEHNTRDEPDNSDD